jgi:hypothetical protein
MDERISIQPLPYRSRQRTFSLLVILFAVALPFLYLYATGYRLDFERPTALISTGGLYLAVERTGAEIYIDDELVRETRTFRRAFYAQNIDVGTHRVHVQKEGYHTWVKELPVSKHLVTEAQAFNLPLVPQVRVVSEWQSATGTAIAFRPLAYASTTNGVRLATSTATTSLVRNPEFVALMVHFATSSPQATTTAVSRARDAIISDAATDTAATTELETATSTVISNGVRLARSGDELYATWVGSFEDMPYYYCAEPFPRYNPEATTTPELLTEAEDDAPMPRHENEETVMHPVQTVARDAECEPTIRMDRRGQTIQDFDFYPGSSDLILLTLEDGVYAVEIDNRAWQNMQPALLGANLRMHLENGNLYVHDGSVIYQVFLNAEVTPSS